MLATVLHDATGAWAACASGARPIISNERLRRRRRLVTRCPRLAQRFEEPREPRPQRADLGLAHGADGKPEPAGVLLRAEGLERHDAEARMLEHRLADVLVRAQRDAPGRRLPERMKPRGEVDGAHRRDALDGVSRAPQL